MNDEMIIQTGKMTFKDALRVLGQHGIGFNEPTGVDSLGRILPGSTFEATFGVHRFYDLTAVMTWLGY